MRCTGFNSKWCDLKKEAEMQNETQNEFQFQMVRFKATHPSQSAPGMFGFNSKWCDLKQALARCAPPNLSVSIPNGAI